MLDHALGLDLAQVSSQRLVYGDVLISMLHLTPIYNMLIMSCLSLVLSPAETCLHFSGAKISFLFVGPIQPASGRGYTLYTVLPMPHTVYLTQADCLNLYDCLSSWLRWLISRLPWPLKRSLNDALLKLLKKQPVLISAEDCREGSVLFLHYVRGDNNFPNPGRTCSELQEQMWEKPSVRQQKNGIKIERTDKNKIYKYTLLQHHRHSLGLRFKCRLQVQNSNAFPRTTHSGIVHT